MQSRLKSPDIKFRVFVGLIALADAVVTLSTRWSWQGLEPDFQAVALLVLLNVVLTHLTFDLAYGAAYTMNLMSIAAAVVSLGPLWGGLVSATGAINFEDLRARRPLVRVLGNAVHWYLSAYLAGLAMMSLGHPPLLVTGNVSLLELSTTTRIAAPLSVLGVFYLSNVTIVVAGVALLESKKLGEVLQEWQPSAHFPSLVVLGLVGILLGHLIALRSLGGLFLISLPMIAVRRVFTVYADLRDAFANTLRALTAAIEAKDPYTRGHSERVAGYAVALAVETGLGAQDIQRIERAALLHDIGKIAVPGGLLTSSEVFRACDMESVRLHPEVARDLLQDIEFLEDVLPALENHHERLDGSGYPRGLAGEEIPLAARILAVVDAYDAMTTDRPYRRAMSQEDALRELKRVAGLEYDAVLVDAFTRVLSRQAQE